jgi:catalase
MAVPKGRVAYEPASRPMDPREDPAAGFVSFPAPESGEKVRARPASFADHYSQARMFFISMTAHEKAHIAAAFSFELGKVETPAIRSRMVGHLVQVHPDLGEAVASRLGLREPVRAARPAVAPRNLPASPALSLAHRVGTLQGRTVGALITDGVDDRWLAELRRAVTAAGARLAVIAPRAGGVETQSGGHCDADHALAAAPSVLFDAVVLAPSAAQAAALAAEPTAVDWVRDAFRHLKVIGHVAAAKGLLHRAGVTPGDGIVAIDQASSMDELLTAAKRHRIWTRDPEA